MEQQLISKPLATNRNVVPLSTLACRQSSAMRCDLPLGRATVCGNTSRREDRGPDSEVIAGGAQSRDVWLIRSGILRLQRHAHDGRRQILSLFLPGEIVGFDEEFRDGVSVETATQSGLCRIDRRRFDWVVDQNDALRQELLCQKQDQLGRLHWLTWSLAAIGPMERLCAFLALSTKFMPYQLLPDGTGVLSMYLTRKDIADLLGTTVESICRVVHKLSRTGAIEIRDPAHFRLLDLSRLIAVGQIEGLFETMTTGVARRRRLLDGQLAPSSADPVCFCGR